MYYPWDSLTIVASPWSSSPGVVVAVGCVGGMSAACVAVIVVVGNTLSWGCTGRVSAAFVASTSGLHCCDVCLQIDVSHQRNTISTHFFIFMGLRQGSDLQAYNISSHAQWKLLRPTRRPAPRPSPRCYLDDTLPDVLQCFSWESHAPTTTYNKAHAVPSYLPPTVAVTTTMVVVVVIADHVHPDDDDNCGGGKPPTRTQPRFACTANHNDGARVVTTQGQGRRQGQGRMPGWGDGSSGCAVESYSTVTLREKYSAMGDKYEITPTLQDTEFPENFKPYLTMNPARQIWSCNLMIIGVYDVNMRIPPILHQAISWTIFAKVSEDAEGPMAPDLATVISLLVVKTGANLSTRVQDVRKEDSILNNRIQDIPGNGGRHVIVFESITKSNTLFFGVQTINIIAAFISSGP
ncbi:hypothetical protein EDB86DRAFT_3131116 [Lactarius hatsudake]|nr:hypothetical protein EDB86DRAFT_3131116 [Lactarius hatsudake]